MLKSLLLKENGLKKLYRYMFKNLDQVQMINLDKSNTFYIEKGTFFCNYNLIILSLKGNKMLQPDEKILFFQSNSYDSSISVLCLSANILMYKARKRNKQFLAAYGHRPYFPGTERAPFKALFLSNCPLQNLSKDLMIGMKFIKILHQDNKLLSRIPVDLLLNFKSLIELNNRNNNITSIPNGIFLHLAALQSFDMTGNALATAGGGSFRDLHSLEHLNLCCNFTNTLTKFQHVSALLTLNLSYNFISNIDKDVLDELRALNNLDISNNLIFVIDPGTFLRN